MKFVVIACLCASASVAVGCADGAGVPTSPSASTAVTSLAASPRSGALHVSKECGGFNGAPGSFCMIESSNLKAIEVDSKILYLQPEKLFTPVGSDVILDLPGPGNNKAFGHCSLALGVCTFEGGTGKFTLFRADVVVSKDPDPRSPLWYWEGTYSFGPQG